MLITFDDAYADTARYGLPVLLRHGFSGAVYVITQRVGRTTEWDGRPVMTTGQIKAWAAEGIEFGAHSRTHPDLTTLDSRGLVDEIIGSKDNIESLTGARVSSFAYPYGIYNETVRNCVKGTFDLAFTCEDGMNRLASDSFLVPRIEIRPSRFMMNFVLQVKLWLRSSSPTATSRGSPITNQKIGVRHRQRIFPVIDTTGAYVARNRRTWSRIRASAGW